MIVCTQIHKCCRKLMNFTNGKKSSKSRDSESREVDIKQNNLKIIDKKKTSIFGDDTLQLPRPKSSKVMRKPTAFVRSTDYNNDDLFDEDSRKNVTTNQRPNTNMEIYSTVIKHGNENKTNLKYVIFIPLKKNEEMNQNLDSNKLYAIQSKIEDPLNNSTNEKSDKLSLISNKSKTKTKKSLESNTTEKLDKLSLKSNKSKQNKEEHLGSSTTDKSDKSLFKSNKSKKELKESLDSSTSEESEISSSKSNKSKVKTKTSLDSNTTEKSHKSSLQSNKSKKEIEAYYLDSSTTEKSDQSLSKSNKPKKVEPLRSSDDTSSEESSSSPNLKTTKRKIVNFDH